RVDDENVEEESLTVCLAVIEEVLTEKKGLNDKKPPVEDQLVKIVDEELEQTNLMKHVIKTDDIEPIKQALYYLVPSKQEFVCKELNKLKKKRLIRESFNPWNELIEALLKKFQIKHQLSTPIIYKVMVLLSDTIKHYTSQ
ncbi:5054_t:CDS:2, partial [Cetraspora pellucida]